VAPKTKTAAGKRNTAEAILEAGERLCAEHGIEAMSIRDVAAAVGVSIPVIYHHYGSRSNLLRAICLNRFGEISAEYQQMLATLEAQQTPSVADIIRAVLQPVNQWRMPGREYSLQFYALALVCPLPEVKDMLDAGVAGLQPGAPAAARTPANTEALRVPALRAWLEVPAALPGHHAGRERELSQPRSGSSDADRRVQDRFQGWFQRCRGFVDSR